MDDKTPDKQPIPDSLGAGPVGGEEGASDPYLDQLDSSLEDLVEEEPTRNNIPAEMTPLEQEVPEAPAPQPVPEAPVQPEAALPEEGGTILDMASDIPVELRVVVGDKKTTLAEILRMKKGELMELENGLDAAVDLMVQDKVVARGELVEIDGRLGVRIIRILE